MSDLLSVTKGEDGLLVSNLGPATIDSSEGNTDLCTIVSNVTNVPIFRVNFVNGLAQGTGVVFMDCASDKEKLVSFDAGRKHGDNVLLNDNHVVAFYGKFDSNKCTGIGEWYSPSINGTPQMMLCSVTVEGAGENALAVFSFPPDCATPNRDVIRLAYEQYMSLCVPACSVEAVVGSYEAIVNPLPALLPPMMGNSMVMPSAAPLFDLSAPMLDPAMNPLGGGLSLEQMAALFPNGLLDDSASQMLFALHQQQQLMLMQQQQQQQAQQQIEDVGLSRRQRPMRSAKAAALKSLPQMKAPKPVYVPPGAPNGVAIRALNMDTNEERIFKSLREASEGLGVHVVQLQKASLGQLRGSGMQRRQVGPWRVWRSVVDRGTAATASRVRAVHVETGEERVYRSVEEVAAFLNVFRYLAQEAVNGVHRSGSGHQIGEWILSKVGPDENPPLYHDMPERKPKIIVKHVITKEERVYFTLVEASDDLGIPTSYISEALKHQFGTGGIPKSNRIEDWTFTRPSNVDLAEVYPPLTKVPLNGVKIKMVHRETGEIRYFKAVTTAERAMGLAGGMIVSAIKGLPRHKASPLDFWDVSLVERPPATYLPEGWIHAWHLGDGRSVLHPTAELMAIELDTTAERVMIALERKSSVDKVSRKLSTNSQPSNIDGWDVTRVPLRLPAVERWVDEEDDEETALAMADRVGDAEASSGAPRVIEGPIPEAPFPPGASIRMVNSATGMNLFFRNIEEASLATQIPVESLSGALCGLVIDAQGISCNSILGYSVEGILQPGDSEVHIPGRLPQLASPPLKAWAKLPPTYQAYNPTTGQSVVSMNLDEVATHVGGDHKLAIAHLLRTSSEPVIHGPWRVRRINAPEVPEGTPAPSFEAVTIVNEETKEVYVFANKAAAIEGAKLIPSINVAAVAATLNGDESAPETLGSFVVKSRSLSLEDAGLQAFGELFAVEQPATVDAPILAIQTDNGRVYVAPSVEALLSLSGAALDDAAKLKIASELASASVTTASLNGHEFTIRATLPLSGRPTIMKSVKAIIDAAAAEDALVEVDIPLEDGEEEAAEPMAPPEPKHKTVYMPPGATISALLTRPVDGEGGEGGDNWAPFLPTAEGVETRMALRRKPHPAKKIKLLRMGDRNVAPVWARNLVTGEERLFASMTEASTTLKLHFAHVSMAARGKFKGKGGHSVGDWEFHRADPDDLYIQQPAEETPEHVEAQRRAQESANQAAEDLRAKGGIAARNGATGEQRFFANAAEAAAGFGLTEAAVHAMLKGDHAISGVGLDWMFVQL